MASVASESAGVIGGDDLRECPGLGAVGFVAPGAEDRCVELRRLDRARVVGVFGLRSVAGFAGDHDVFAEFFLIDNVGVAAFANIVAGVRNRAGRGFRDGRSSVMAVLAERLRDNGSAQNDEGGDRDDDHSGQTDQVFRVLKQALLSGRPLRDAIPQKTQ